MARTDNAAVWTFRTTIAAFVLSASILFPAVGARAADTAPWQRIMQGADALAAFTKGTPQWIAAKGREADAQGAKDPHRIEAELRLAIIEELLAAEKIASPDIVGRSFDLLLLAGEYDRARTVLGMFSESVRCLAARRLALRIAQNNMFGAAVELAGPDGVQLLAELALLQAQWGDVAAAAAFEEQIDYHSAVGKPECPEEPRSEKQTRASLTALRVRTLSALIHAVERGTLPAELEAARLWRERLRDVISGLEQISCELASALAAIGEVRVARRLARPETSYSDNSWQTKLKEAQCTGSIMARSIVAIGFDETRRQAGFPTQPWPALKTARNLAESNKSALALQLVENVFKEAVRDRDDRYLTEETLALLASLWPAPEVRRNIIEQCSSYRDCKSARRALAFAVARKATGAELDAVLDGIRWDDWSTERLQLEVLTAPNDFRRGNLAAYPDKLALAELLVQSPYPAVAVALSDLVLAKEGDRYDQASSDTQKAWELKFGAHVAQNLFDVARQTLKDAAVKKAPIADAAPLVKAQIAAGDLSGALASLQATDVTLKKEDREKLIWSLADAVARAQDFDAAAEVAKASTDKPGSPNWIRLMIAGERFHDAFAAIAADQALSPATRLDLLLMSAEQL